MLRISQLKLPVTHTEEDLKKKIVHTLMCRTEAVQSYEIIKQSLDARKKTAFEDAYPKKACRQCATP